MQNAEVVQRPSLAITVTDLTNDWQCFVVVILRDLDFPKNGVGQTLIAQYRCFKIAVPHLSRQGQCPIVNLQSLLVLA